MKHMKKIISGLLLLAVLLSVAGVTTVSAAEDAISATVFEDFSRLKVGEKVKSKYVKCVEEEGTMAATNTLGAIGGVNALKLSYTSLRGYHNIGGDQGFQIVFDEAKSLKDMEYIMLYVKLPVSRADDLGNNWGKSGIAPMMYLGDLTWVQLRHETPVEYLSVNGSEWKTVNSYYLYVDLPSGFEGYVKLPLSGYYADNLTDPIQNHSVEYMIYQFSNMGGQCGNGYINAIYGVSNDSDSIKVRLNGDTAAHYLVTGGTSEDIAGQSFLMDKAMKAEPLLDWSGYSVGYDLAANGLAAAQNKKDINFTLVDSVIGGAFTTPCVKISSKTLGGFHDTDPMYDFKYKAFCDISEMKAILFYIKCAAPHPQKPDVSSIRFNIRSNNDANNEKWTLLGNSSILAMSTGTGVWKNYAAHGDGNGIVDLPANFEGWVMVNIADMLMNPIADDLEGRYGISTTIQFQAVGGECGDCYFGPMYMITDMEGKSNKLITLNGYDVLSLATNSYASENDLLNIGPKVGNSYDTFPIGTLDVYPQVRNVTASDAVLEWDPVEKASQYRVDVYCDAQQNGIFCYECTHSLLSEECVLKLSDLQKGTNYYFCVTAIDDTGSELAVFNSQTFATPGDSTAYSDEKVTHTSVVTVNQENEGSNTTLIILVSAAIVVAAALVICVVIVIKKRKVRVEK